MAGRHAPETHAAAKDPAMQSRIRLVCANENTSRTLARGCGAACLVLSAVVVSMGCSTGFDLSQADMPDRNQLLGTLLVKFVSCLVGLCSLCGIRVDARSSWIARHACYYPVCEAQLDPCEFAQ